MEEQNHVCRVYWDNIKRVRMVKDMIRTGRTQDLGGILVETSRFTKNLMEFAKETGGDGAFLEILAQILDAQEREDYTLLTDSYEGQLLPYLIQFQQGILSKVPAEELVDPNWRSNNLACIRKMDEELATRLEEEAETAFQNEAYQIGIAQTGAFTLSVYDGSIHQTIHSTIDPVEEARQYAEHVYDPMRDSYCIFGTGLLYHAEELYHLFPDVKLQVVVPKLSILNLAITYRDLTALLPHIRFLYRDVWREFRDVLQGDAYPVIYRPMLRAMNPTLEPGIRKTLNKLVNRMDGIKRYERTFIQNWEYNRRHCDGYVDEIMPMLSGKSIIIVAAGPSLDMNVEQLRHVPAGTCVIAVGTIYKKLINLGIAMDYVIIEDVKVGYQVEGVTGPTPPMLLLATADYRVSRDYQGKKYLICQEGYALAATYAKTYGYRCYNSGGSVTTLALDLAICAEARSIAFVGLDLAYKGNQEHASDTRFEKATFQAEKQVPGVNGDTVYTTEMLYSYQEWIEERIEQEDCIMPVYDATEGGARIKGTEIITLRDYLNQSL